jgi:hypothetical protein
LGNFFLLLSIFYQRIRYARFQFVVPYSFKLLLSSVQVLTYILYYMSTAVGSVRCMLFFLGSSRWWLVNCATLPYLLLQSAFACTQSNYFALPLYPITGLIVWRAVCANCYVNIRRYLE